MKFILAVLCCLNFATAVPPEANKCDSGIIAAIQELWGDDVPSMIIENSVDKGKEVVVGTTEGYYSNDTRCVYSFFTETSLDISFINKNGEITTENVDISEEDGVLIYTDTQIKRYQVYDMSGVCGFYRCHDEGEDGIPEGIVKVQDSGFEQPILDEAIAAMNSLGIQITQRLPETCP